MIPFNKPHLTGSEIAFILEAVKAGRLSGNGEFTKRCQRQFEERYRFSKCLLTTSCTDALEMAALLIDVQPGDEVIMPSFTFVSTANAFVLRGAKIVFVDSRPDHPGMDESSIEALVTDRTVAIVPVHYAGVACDMDTIADVAKRHDLYVIEDAAQSINSFYTGSSGQLRALGSIGELGAFSFHETKNISAGEGGMLAINDQRFVPRGEVIWEKGTNRSAFFRGEVDKYGWVDVGSSFLPSELTAAFLWAQIQNLDEIQERRLSHWSAYYEALASWAERNDVRLPFLPSFATNNAHMFYLVCRDVGQRTELIRRLKDVGAMGVFHYQSLHRSAFYQSKHDGKCLPFSDQYSDCLLRLPLFYDLTSQELSAVVAAITGSGGS